jgi:hypothetical protein
MMSEHSKAECIPGPNLITTGKADAMRTVINGFAAIVAVRVCQLMGEHQFLSHLIPVFFSFIFHIRTTLFKSNLNGYAYAIADCETT